MARTQWRYDAGFYSRRLGLCICLVLLVWSIDLHGGLGILPLPTPDLLAMTAEVLTIQLLGILARVARATLETIPTSSSGDVTTTLFNIGFVIGSTTLIILGYVWNRESYRMGWTLATSVLLTIQMLSLWLLYRKMQMHPRLASPVSNLRTSTGDEMKGSPITKPAGQPAVPSAIPSGFRLDLPPSAPLTPERTLDGQTEHSELPKDRTNDGAPRSASGYPRHLDLPSPPLPFGRGLSPISDLLRSLPITGRPSPTDTMTTSSPSPNASTKPPLRFSFRPNAVTPRVLPTSIRRGMERWFRLLLGLTAPLLLLAIGLAAASLWTWATRWTGQYASSTVFLHTITVMFLACGWSMVGVVLWFCFPRNPDLDLVALATPKKPAIPMPVERKNEVKMESPPPVRVPIPLPLATPDRISLPPIAGPTPSALPITNPLSPSERRRPHQAPLPWLGSLPNAHTVPQMVPIDPNDSSWAMLPAVVIVPPRGNKEEQREHDSKESNGSESQVASPSIFSRGAKPKDPIAPPLPLLALRRLPNPIV